MRQFFPFSHLVRGCFHSNDFHKTQDQNLAHNLNTLQRLLTNNLLVVFFSGGRQLENNYISKIMFNIKSQSPDQRLRSFSPHPNIVSVQTWEKLGQFLPFCATDSLRPSTFSLLTLHPGLCGSLLTWTRQRLGAHAGVWVPWELGSSQKVGPCGSKAFKTLSGSSKWTNYPTLRLSDWHKPPIFFATAAYKGGIDRITLLLQVMSPDLRATDVGHWYWFSLVR